MKATSNVTCPFCGHINNVKIPETMGLMSVDCDACKKMILGKQNPHGGTGVLCSHGDTPGFHIQEREKNK